MTGSASRASIRTRRSGERGSALLIVFLFAAIAAIMLYKELPVAAFEAQRNKEQLTIDRGNEYARAVQLYVRKFGMYPNSLEQLENTNRMRFLRHRYKDPFTGKDDWRLLHAGPGGQLLDSKVNPIGTNKQNGNANNSGGANSSSSSNNSNTGFSSANSSFGSSSGFGNSSTNSSNAAPAVVIPPLPQRPPEIPANGTGNGGGASADDQNPMTPLLSSDQNASATPGQNAAAAETNAPITQPSQNGTQMQPTNADNSTPTDMMRNLLNNPNGPAPAGQPATSAPSSNTSSSSTGSGMGNLATGGGIAGVGMVVAGQSIKTVNDQSDYSLWEFWYDPTKDPMRGLTSGAPAAGTATGQTGAAQTGFGGFNQNGSTGTAAPATAAPTTTPPNTSSPTPSSTPTMPAPMSGTPSQ